MHSTAEREEASSRRRRASPGKPESRRGKEEKRGNPLERKKPVRGDPEGRGRNGSVRVEWDRWVPRRGGAGQTKERNVRERTFRTSLRTKSNFSPTTKLSYFPRNMHARGRAQVFRFPARSSSRRNYPRKGIF